MPDPEVLISWRLLIERSGKAIFALAAQQVLRKIDDVLGSGVPLDLHRTTQLQDLARRYDAELARVNAGDASAPDRLQGLLKRLLSLLPGDPTTPPY